ncbi:MAG: hypothetical protein LBG90_06725 [Spirochaetaceae bacterium]|jgi:hypothetical protein|nr:hypothetical protein [Spirochaetaceae bacterium]
MDINELKENIGVIKLPKELENLIVFQNSLSDSLYFSNGFDIQMNCKDGLRYGWCDKEDFLNKLIPFASANGSGSIYSIWINDNNSSLDKMPIAVFGDEGGAHIVSENILQLFHLLTYDVEICVDENSAYFKKNNKYTESKNHKKYLTWIKENYGLNKIEEPEKVIKNAQEKYKNDFNNWFKIYYKKWGRPYGT